MSEIKNQMIDVIQRLDPERTIDINAPFGKVIEELHDAILAISPSSAKLQTNKIAYPSLEVQTILPDDDNDGMRSVTVAPITADIIPGLEPQNIVEGVTIAGVEGTAAADIDSIISGEVSVLTSNATQIVGWDLSGLDSITEINMPFITQIDTGFGANSKVLRTVRMNNLKNIITTSEFLAGCPGLVDFECNSLITFSSGTWTFANSALLLELIFPKLRSFQVALRNLNITTMIFPSLGRWNPTNFYLSHIKYFVIGTSDCTVDSSSGPTQIANAGGNIYVPDDYVDSYKSATNWSSAASIIKPISELPPEILQKYLDAKAIAEEDET